MTALHRFAPLLAAAIFSVTAACGPDVGHDEPAGPDAKTGDLIEIDQFGPNPGGLSMLTYVPDDLPAGAPLVVALHGCGQTAADYDTETGWTKYADRDGFALVLPETGPGNHPNRCFNWFRQRDQTRGSGEPRSIVSMVEYLLDGRDLDRDRVFVTGLSAGGYMTAVLMATYPELVAGGAVVAGGPYGCATGPTEALNCMNPGVEKSPATWGDRVRDATDHEGPWPVVSVWHGSADATVDDRNRRETVKQWTDVHETDQSPEVAESVAGDAHRVYESDGQPVVETYHLEGMGHGVPVDPGDAADQCGETGAYVRDADICSTYHIGRFWGVVDAPDA